MNFDDFWIFQNHLEINIINNFFFLITVTQS